MRRARVDYPSGRELLAAYWGFLGSGGLVVPKPALAAGSEALAAGGEEATDGEPVVLEVRIASLRKEYCLQGRIRRTDGQSVVIAFDEGQAQDMLLAAAWADGQGVPERRHRRWNLELPVRFRTFEREGSGRLVNLSRGGCCVQVDSEMRSGTRIFLVGDRFLVDGVVRWARSGSRLMGVEFARFQEDMVHQLLGPPTPAQLQPV